MKSGEIRGNDGASYQHLKVPREDGFEYLP